MNSSDYCILVAEDQLILQEDISCALSDHGYCVIRARDGYEAMRREAEYTGIIHLLVTNVHMPHMGGHELALKMREKRPDLKVLIVSGQNEKDFPPEARGHDFVLLKPIASKVVVAKVGQLLRELGDVHPGV